jgi:Spy/CpxP family protein refolding chaperone
MAKGMMIVAAITLAATWVSPATAVREWPGGYGREPGNVADIATGQDLNLTAGQTEKINTLRQAHLKDIKPLQEQLFKKSRELRSHWLARTPDRDRILALQKEVQNLRYQMTDKFMGYRLEVRQILTPEQQAKTRTFEPEHGMGRRGGAGTVSGHGYEWGTR